MDKNNIEINFVDIVEYTDEYEEFAELINVNFNTYKTAIQEKFQNVENPYKVLCSAMAIQGSGYKIKI